MAYVGRKGIWSDKTEVESNRPINRLSPVVVIFEKWSIQIYREIAQRVPDAIFLAPTWRCAPVLAEKDSEHPCAGQEIRNSPSFCRLYRRYIPTYPSRVYTYIQETQNGEDEGPGHGRVFNVTNATMETAILGSRPTQYAADVFIQLQRTRGWERRGIHARPCNLVIDQFVAIWHFVCTGPVNCVYPGCDDRRVNEVCLGTTSRGDPSDKAWPFSLKCKPS